MTNEPTDLCFFCKVCPGERAVNLPVSPAPLKICRSCNAVFSEMMALLIKTFIKPDAQERVARKVFPKERPS